MLRLLLVIFIAAWPVFTHAACNGKNLLKNPSSDLNLYLQKEVNKQSFGSGRYWEITKNGKSSFVMGTYHSDHAKIRKLPQNIRKRLKAARILQVELTAKSNAEFIKTSIAKNKDLLKPSKEDLSKYFSKDEWAIILKDLSERGIRKKIAVQLKPRAMLNILSIPLCTVREDTNKILDRVIEKFARTKKIPVEELDTIAGMLKLVPTYSDKGVIQEIKYLVPFTKSAADIEVTSRQLYLNDETWKIYEFFKLIREKKLSKAVADRMDREFHTQLAHSGVMRPPIPI